MTTGMTVSAGLMASIITSTPTAVVIWVTTEVRFWLMALLMDVHIVCDDAENIAVGVGVVIVQLQPVHLPVDVAPELLHHMGGDPGHAEALEEGEQLGDQVQGHQRGQQPENGIPVKDSIGDADEQRGGHPPDEEGARTMKAVLITADSIQRNRDRRCSFK